MRRIHVIALIVLLLTVPSAAGAHPATPAAGDTVTTPVAASGDFAGLVDVGGRKLYLECHGTGSPTVVLVSGYRASARYYQPSAPSRGAADDGPAGVAAFAGVCAYDRREPYASIGAEDLVGRSDPIAQPRTAPEVVAELHALLQAAVPGGRRAYPEAGGDLAFGHAGGRQPQHVAALRMDNLSPGIPRSSSKGAEPCRFARSPNGPHHPRPQAGRDRPEQVVAINRKRLVAINRKGWSRSSGARKLPPDTLICDEIAENYPIDIESPGHLWRAQPAKNKTGYPNSAPVRPVSEQSTAERWQPAIGYKSPLKSF